MHRSVVQPLPSVRFLASSAAAVAGSASCVVAELGVEIEGLTWRGETSEAERCRAARIIETESHSEAIDPMLKYCSLARSLARQAVADTLDPWPLYGRPRSLADVVIRRWSYSVVWPFVARSPVVNFSSDTRHRLHDQRIQQIQCNALLTQAVSRRMHDRHNSGRLIYGCYNNRLSRMLSVEDGVVWSRGQKICQFWKTHHSRRYCL